MIKIFFFISVVLSTWSIMCAQERINGPVISDFGATFKVESPDFKPDPNLVYKVVFDIHDTPDDPARLNPSLNTLARFINMHAAAGVPVENLHVACVIHNKATKDVMDDAAYRKKYGTDNPNISLMKALKDAGAKIYFCGQSMHARGIDRESLAEPVEVGLSALTVILTLEQEGYRLIKF